VVEVPILYLWGDGVSVVFRTSVVYKNIIWEENMEIKRTKNKEELENIMDKIYEEYDNKKM
jgi:hypothetical protein